MKRLDMSEWERLTPEQQWDAFATLQDDYEVVFSALPERMKAWLGDTLKPVLLIEGTARTRDPHPQP